MTEIDRSEQQLAQIQQIFHLGSWTLDIPSNTVTWSDEMYRIFGVDPAEFQCTYESILEFVLPEDRLNLENAIEKTSKTLEPFVVDYRIRRPDGSIRMLTGRGEILLDGEGKPFQMFGVAQDITERIATEESLRAKDKLLRAAVEGAPSILFVIDAKGNFELAMGKSLNQFVPAEKLIGHSVFEIAANRPDILLQIERALRGEVFVGIITARETYLEVHYQPVQNENGEVVEVIGVATDVTPQVIAERSIREGEVRFQQVVENVKDYAIYTIDPYGFITSWNEGAQRIKGYTEQEVLGRNFSQFYPVEDRANHKPERGLMAAARDGRYEDEALRVRKDGSMFWADAVITPLKDEEGHLKGFVKVVRDITARKEAEQALKKQTSYVKLLQDIAVAANEAISVEAAMQYALDRICENTGWQVGHALRRDSLPPGNMISMKLWHVDDLQSYDAFRRCREAIQFPMDVGIPGKALSSGKPVWVRNIHQEQSIQRMTECDLPSLKTGIALPVMAGRKVVGVLEFVSENELPPDPELIDLMTHVGTQLGRVVERKESEVALRRSESRFRTIFEKAALGIELIDLDGHLLECNLVVEDILGYEPDELRHLTWENVKHPANIIVNTELFNDLRQGKCDFYRQEKPYLRKDGHLAWGTLSVSLVRDLNGEPQFAVGMIEDISERKQMEAELLELQRRLMEGREAERVHLAQELHDGPVQDLLAFSFNLKAYEINLFGENVEIMQDLQHSLQRVVRTLRSICGDLRPPTLVPFGLEKAIRSHAEIFQDQNPDLNLHLDLTPDGQTLPEQVRLALYRIYQQMLINIVRHAQAKNIWVTFRLNDQQIQLIIQDDGGGFRLPTRLIDLARQGHLGIVGAAERAESIGGEFKIDSQPGQGTTIRVNVPRKQEEIEVESPGREEDVSRMA